MPRVNGSVVICTAALRVHHLSFSESPFVCPGPAGRPFLLDCAFDTRGREVVVEAEIKGKQDLIKSTKNDEDDKFIDKLSIKAQGIEEARVIVHTLKYLVNKLNS